MSAQGPFRNGERTDFSLIETLRWSPVSGFVRGQLHLERLQRSAAQLGFIFERDHVHEQLAAAVSEANRDLRVRLVLTADGDCKVEVFPFVPLPEETVWQVAIASARLESANPLLRHKTTRRSIYEKARSEFPAHEVDEIILLNEKGELCEGTITNVFVLTQDDVLLTPSLECGLLAGVLRAEMLQTGKVQEARIPAADIAEAKALFVGNSLRGLIKARFHNSSPLY